MPDALWSDAPAPTSEEQARHEKDALLEYSRVLITGCSESRVVNLFLASSSSVGDMVVRSYSSDDPFMSYLRRGAPADADLQGMPSGDQTDIEAERWRMMCERAEAGDEALLSPLRAALLQSAADGMMDLLKIRDPQADHRDGAVQARLEGLAMEELSSGQMDLGPGIRARFQRFFEHIRTAREPDALAGMDQQSQGGSAFYPALWPFILKMTPLAGSRDGASGLLPLLVKSPGSEQVLFSNPSWNEDGWRGAVDGLLADLSAWSHYDEAPRVTNSRFAAMLFAHAKERGWSLDLAQEGAFGAVVAAASHQNEEVKAWLVGMGGRPGRKGTKAMRAKWNKWGGHSGATSDFMLTLASAPCVSNQEVARQFIVSWAGENNRSGQMDIIPAMLATAEGPVWLELASSFQSQIAKASEGNRWYRTTHDQTATRVLAATTPSQLAGVDRTALKALLQRFADKAGELPNSAAAARALFARSPRTPQPTAVKL